MKTFYLIAALLIGCTSCTKEAEEASSANITITGVRDADLTLTSNSSYTFPVTVNSGTGSPQDVSLSGDNLPKGVSASFNPSRGTTPFTAMATFRYDFTGSGGVHDVKLVGNTATGSKSYPLKVTLDFYRGWRLGDSTYYKTDVYKDKGNTSTYPNIRVYAVRSGILTISFGLGKSLPSANKTYRITSSSGTADDIQISMNDEPEIFSATGVGNPTGTFTFDTLGKFTFKCSGVEMSNGVQKKTLDCSFSE